MALTTPRRDRLVGWVIAALFLPLIPLFFGALATIRPDTGPTLVEAFFNEELLGVAFTVSCVALLDIVVSLLNTLKRNGDEQSKLNTLKLCIFGLTILLMLLCTGIYVLLKTHGAYWPPVKIIPSILILYGGTMLAAYACEWLS